MSDTRVSDGNHTRLHRRIRRRSLTLAMSVLAGIVTVAAPTVLVPAAPVAAQAAPSQLSVDVQWNNSPTGKSTTLTLARSGVSSTSGSASASSQRVSELDVDTTRIAINSSNTVTLSATIPSNTSATSLACRAGAGAASPVAISTSGSTATATYLPSAGSVSAGVTCTWNFSYLANPDLAAACGTDVVVVLDESGSISTSNAIDEVEAAVRALVEGLNNTGSRIRFVEFSSNARDSAIRVGTGLTTTTDFQTVNDDLVANVNTYLNGAGNAQVATTYSPGPGQQYTNWEAGLAEAATPLSNAKPGAPLVVFITDGQPNTIGTTGNSAEGAATESAAALAAYEEMAFLQSRPGHVLAIGVGEALNGSSNTVARDRLRYIVEPNSPMIYTSGTLDISQTDVMEISQFDQLDDALRQVAFGLCSPSLSVKKVDQNNVPVAGWPFTVTVDVQPVGGTDQFEWVTPNFPAGSRIAPSQASVTQTVNTSSSGVANFQWTPNTVAAPRQWDSIVTLNETLQPGWTLADTQANCEVRRLLSNGSVSTFSDVTLNRTSPANPLPPATVTWGFRRGGNTFPLQKADIMTCTVMNVRPATITITKNAIPDSTTDFAFTASAESPTSPPLSLPAAFDLDDDPNSALPNSRTWTVSPATYKITEVASPGWSLSGLTCTLTDYSANDVSSQTTVLASGLSTLVLKGGDNATCVYTNSAITPTLTINKTTSGGAIGDSFVFDVTNLTPAGGLTVTTTSATAGTSGARNLVVGTTYGVSERDKAGWAKGALTCSVDPAGAVGPSSVDPTSFRANAGDVFVCSITNTKLGSITIIKDALPNDAQDFAFTTTGSGLSGFTLDDDSDGARSNTEVFSNLMPGTYTVTEGFTTGWSLTGLSCTAGGTTDRDARKASITLAAGQNVTCTFVNSKRGNLTVSKSAESVTPVTGSPGQYDVTYKVTAANSGIAPETFSLSDVPDFGTGVTFVKQSASVTGTNSVINAGWTGVAPNTTLASGTMNGGDVYVYTIVLRVTVAASTTQPVRTCATAPTPDRGAYNRAVISWDNLTAESAACATLPSPAITVAKTAVANSVVEAGGIWTVQYNLVVSNTGTGPGTYSLNDTPAFTPGVIVDKIEITAANPTITPTLPSTTVSPLVIVTDRAIAAAGAHTYTVKVTFHFDPAAAGFTTTKINRDCDIATGATTGTGTLNRTRVTPNIGAGNEATACLPLPDPKLKIVKSVVADTLVYNQATSSWSVQYKVSVSHDTGSVVPATYTLVDTPSFGTGVTITKMESPSVTPDVTAPFALTLATNRQILPGSAAQDYVVTITFTINYADPTLALQCAAAGSGTFNSAVVTWQDSGTATATACQSIPNMTVSKTAGAAVADGPGLFTTTYTVDVTNKGIATQYNLGDTFDFASTVEVVGVDSVTLDVDGAGGAAPVPVANFTGIAPNNVLASARAIAAGTVTPVVHQYKIVVRVRLNGDESNNDRTCATGPDRGLFNSTTLTNSGFPQSATACTNLPGPGITMIKTPNAGTASGPVNGTWTATYSIAVTNSGSAPGRYTLTDVMSPLPSTTVGPVAVTSANPAVNIANYVNGAAIVTSQEIAAGTTHTFTVTVPFTVATPIPAASVPSLTCVTAGEPSIGSGQVNTATVSVLGSGTPIVDRGCASIPTGTIIIVKNVEGANGTFTFSGTFTTDTPFTIATTGTATGGTGSKQFNNVVAGPYTVQELGLPADYNGRLVCSETTSPSNTTVTNLVGAISLQPGETVTCTFTNTQMSTIVVDKQTTPAADATEFDFTLAGQSFKLTDLAPARSSGLLAPGTYTVNELARAGWQLTNLSCATTSGASSSAIAGASATITLGAGDTVSCVYKNTKLGAVSVVKTSGPVSLVSGNRYRVAYDVVVSNTSFLEETYDLVDAVNFGAGTSNIVATVVAPAGSTTVAGWNGIGNNLMVDDGVIPANSSRTFVVSVQFDVAAAIVPAARDCLGAPGEATGTLNTATVTSRGQSVSDDACSEIPPPAITISKSISSGPTRNAAGVWTIAYDLTVTNGAAAGTGSYSLTDSLKFGGGVTITSVVPSAVTAGLTVNPAFNGQANQQLATGSLAAGAVHVYRVVVTATAVATTPSQVDCTLGTDPGTGFLNAATITVDGVPTSSIACAPFSTLTLVKNLISDDGGQGTLSQFVLSATPTQGAAVINAPDPDASLATGVSAAVAAGSYTLAETTNAAYDASGWTCVNGALTGSVVSVVAGASVVCTITNDDKPVDLALTKNDGGAVAIAGGAAFDYTITVQNVGSRNVDSAEPVTVTDVLPAGLSFVSFPANCAASGQTLSCSIDRTLVEVGDAPVVITVSARLAANAPSGTYTNKAFVTTQDDPACVGASCVPICPTSDQVLSVAVDTGSNNVDCEDTPAGRQATISVTKTDSVDTPINRGDTFSYGIVVTNNGPSTVTNVTLADPLPAQLSLVGATGADWTCNGTNPLACTWAGTLGAGGSSSTLTVSVRLDPAFVGTLVFNTAFAQALVDDKGTPDPADDVTTTASDDETTPVSPGADLAIVKTSSNPTPDTGGTFNWILQITNNGPTAAQSVVITDQVPDRVTVTGVSSAEFSCSATGNAVTCTKASMAVGETGQVTIAISVPANLPAQSIENIGSVTSSTPDPDLTNNSDADTVLTRTVAVEPPVPTIPDVIPTLPITGTDLGRIVAIAFALLAAGWCLVIARRRRRGDVS